MKLEICANSVVSAINAESGGADRVELCENMAEGGTTPGSGSIIQARKHLKIELYVMIRPRGADFHYSQLEFEIMKEDISLAKKYGADGVVFGILNSDGSIDKPRMSELAEISRPMKITCHRSFDMTPDPFRAMEDLIEIGIDRILTSGQQNNALKGSVLIRELITAAKDRIILMPGGGIKEENLEEIIMITTANEYHLNLTGSFPSQMKFKRQGIHMGKQGYPEYEIMSSDTNRIKTVKEIIQRYS